MANPADSIEQWPIDRLIPYARNSRTHSDAQVAQIAASIREWGWTTPDATEPVSCRIYRNDETPMLDADIVIEPGTKVEVTPRF